MNKENNKTAAGSRRSAIAARIKLREEWSALKEIDSQPNSQTNSQQTRLHTNVLNKKPTNVKVFKKPAKENVKPHVPVGRLNRQSNTRSPSEALRGVVALVEVGSESRALPLRAALAAMGASVMPEWSPLITHLVWAQGGCRGTRARGRALASALVSPLWVEACAASSSRLSERAFPAVTRPSDLPSPRTLKQMLKKAEAENMPIANLLNDSDEKEKCPRLRISSDIDQDTNADTSLDTSENTSKDTSKDTSMDTSADTSRDTSKNTTTDVESRVNTAPRRALPKVSESVSPRPATRRRRKLFTHKEGAMGGSADDNDKTTQSRLNIPKPLPTNKTLLKTNQPAKSKPSRKELARAERITKRFLAACSGTTQSRPPRQQVPRIVLTGMPRTERREVTAAILSLKGRIQKRVNRRTTHVLLGSCRHEDGGVSGITPLSLADQSRVIHRSDLLKARTFSALSGAARGARVLLANWAGDCAKRGEWLHHRGYEVQHLKKISQKARVERAALGKLRSEYAYDIFCGMRVLVDASAEQRDAAIQLLKLCNADVQDGGPNLATQPGKSQRHAFVTQNGEIRYGVGENTSEFDMRIGAENGDVTSKWVFDSVAAARMRTSRRYRVTDMSSQIADDMANIFIENC